MQTLKILLDEGAFTPRRAHPQDAGLDLMTPAAVTIPGTARDGQIHGAAIDTGVHIVLPPHTFGKLESKSGLNVRHGIVCLGGVIDEGYTGSIVVKLYNLAPDDYSFQPGDKIVQLLIQPCLAPDIEFTDSLPSTPRGSAGFGSTGAGCAG